MNVPLQGLLRLVQELETNSSPAYIARYRPDVAAGLDERRINQVRDRLRSFLDLADRRITILTALSREDRLTPEMREKIESAMDRRTLEDLYLPFRPKPRTIADDALDKDLEPVARFIWAQEPSDADLAAETTKLAPEGVSVEDALAGGRAIIARWLAENVEVRRDLRKVAFAESVVTVSAIPTERRLSARDETQRQKAAALDGLRKPVSEIQWRQMLSIRRHARDRWLQYAVEIPRDHCIEYLRSRLVRDADSSFVEQLELSAALAFDEFLAPSLGNEVRLEFEDRVDEEAVRAYSKNLRKVLGTSPAGATPVIGLETSRPGGWRAVVVGADGEVLEHAVVREDPDRPSKGGSKAGAAAAQTKEAEAKPEAEQSASQESAPDAEAAQDKAPDAESAPAESVPAQEAAAEPSPEATPAQKDVTTADAQAPSAADAAPTEAAETSAETPETAEAAESTEAAAAEPAPEADPAAAAEAPAVEAVEKAPDAILPFMAPTPDDSAGAEGADSAPEAASDPAPDTPAVDDAAAADAAVADPPAAETADQAAAAEQPAPAEEPKSSEAPAETEPAVASEEASAPAPAPADEQPAAAAVAVEADESAVQAEQPAATVQQPAAEEASAAPVAAAGAAVAAEKKPARQPKQKKQPKKQQREQAAPKAPPPPHVPLAELIERHGVTLVAMGSGPRVRSVERFVRAEARKAKRPVSTVSVNEGGSWIYATSKNARRELPQLDPASRSAATLARRLQDSLSELVKIDPRVVGIGQGYQEVDQKRLRQALHDQVRSSVQEAGVDVNRASLELLAAAPGMTERVAKRIVERRTKNGPYASREELHKTQGVSARVWEQAAGFLRVPGGENPLDATGVHPRHYEKLNAMLAAAGVTVEKALENPRGLDSLDLDPFVDDDFPKVLLSAILRELRPQSINPRGKFSIPDPVVGVEPLDEPKVGMKVEGAVTNAAAFGVFVDIGAGTDGLVHVSQLSSELRDKGQDGIQPGDKVTVWITNVAPDAGRISLSMHEPREPRETSRQRRTSPEARRHGDDRRRPRRRDDRPDRLPVARVFGPDREAKAKEESQLKKMSVSDKLSLLQDRFRTKTDG